ncbi:MAG: galactokinase [Akkermansiaceae bacterium]|nr:galactokinase [Akkermansiaceae bacterium]
MPFDPTDSAAFVAAFGRAPRIGVRAPGRINLIGEHIDYLDGWVLPAAIEPGISAFAAPIDSPEIRIHTSGGAGLPTRATVSLDNLHPRSGSDRWLNYIVGVLALFRSRGVEFPGFELAIDGDLPIGAGLSSSAALETATALVAESLAGARLDPIERARICRQAEHEFAGVPCGIMDQLAVGACRAGHALWIDCRTLETRAIPLPDNVSLVVADTGVKHALADGAYRNRREACETAARLLGVDSLRDADPDQIDRKAEKLGEVVHRRARHAVSEMRRVHAFTQALESGDIAALGDIMREGHDSLRDDLEVSCAELDHLVNVAYEFGLERGLIGSRMTGGGFGGSTVSLVRSDAAPALMEHLAESFRARFGGRPRIFATAAADAARVLFAN